MAERTGTSTTAPGGIDFGRIGAALIGFAIVWGVWSLTYLMVTGVPRIDRFNPDDREWWSVPIALVGLALVLLHELRARRRGA